MTFRKKFAVNKQVMLCPTCIAKIAELERQYRAQVERAENEPAWIKSALAGGDLGTTQKALNKLTIYSLARRPDFLDDIFNLYIRAIARGDWPRIASGVKALDWELLQAAGRAEVLDGLAARLERELERVDPYGSNYEERLYGAYQEALRFANELRRRLKVMNHR